jgi:hypothetical protein
MVGRRDRIETSGSRIGSRKLLDGFQGAVALGNPGSGESRFLVSEGVFGSRETVGLRNQKRRKAGFPGLSSLVQFELQLAGIGAEGVRVDAFVHDTNAALLVGADASAVGSTVRAVSRGGGFTVRPGNAEVVDAALDRVAGSIIDSSAIAELAAGGEAFVAVREELVVTRAGVESEVTVVLTPCATNAAARRACVAAMECVLITLEARCHASVVDTAADGVSGGVGVGSDWEGTSALAVIEASVAVEVLTATGVAHDGTVCFAGRIVRCDFVNTDSATVDATVGAVS